MSSSHDPHLLILGRPRRTAATSPAVGSRSLSSFGVATARVDVLELTDQSGRRRRLVGGWPHTFRIEVALMRSLTGETTSRSIATETSDRADARPPEGGPQCR